MFSGRTLALMAGKRVRDVTSHSVAGAMSGRLGCQRPPSSGLEVAAAAPDAGRLPAHQLLTTSSPSIDEAKSVAPVERHIPAIAAQHYFGVMGVRLGQELVQQAATVAGMRRYSSEVVDTPPSRCSRRKASSQDDVATVGVGGPPESHQHADSR
jgi:hypothetical protein